MPPEQTYPETNEQASKGQTLLSVTNKLNAMGLMARGWRGAELFQPKLQWIVQQVGSWAAFELHTLTAANPSPKTETTKGHPHLT